MGSGEQLMSWLTGRELPAGARMASIGVLIHNVGTAYAVHRALRFGEPLIRRVVTVAGGAVRQPRNVDVALGTPASALIHFCGGLTEEPTRLVMGGPMMGIALPDLDVPVIKGCSGVLALSAAEAGETEEGDCIRCGACSQACPLHLMPLDMAAAIRAGDIQAAQGMGVEDCLTCGACAYLCPAHIPLSHYFDYAKGESWATAQSQRQQDLIRNMGDAKKERLAREAAERRAEMARRRAEAAAAKEKENAQ
jgi:electron transport complex protein RnfC